MTDPSDEYITPTEMVDTSLVQDEVAHTTAELNQNDNSEVNVFDVVAETGQPSRFDIFDLNDPREEEIAAFDPQYTIGRIPELCELCDDVGKRNAALKICASYKKQICESCEDILKHLEACDPCDREIRVIVEDADDGQYAIGRIPEPCELCLAVGERRLAVKYCVSCKKHICKFCVDAHKRFEVLMRHEIVDTESLESNRQLRSTKCEQHEDKDLDTFCINHNSFCCVTCAVKHPQCALTTNIAAIESGSKRALAFVKQKYQQIETHVEKVRARNVKSGADFRNKIENLKRLLQKRKQNIENALGVIQLNFDARSRELLAFTEKEIKSSIKKIDKVRLLCRERIENIDNILEVGQPVHVVAMHNVVIDEYLKAASDIDREDIKEKIFHCRLKLLSKLHHLQEELIVQVDEELKIVSGQVCIPKCEDIVNVLQKRKVIRTNEHKVRLVSDCTPKYCGIAAISGGQHLVLSDSCGASSYCGNVCLYDIRKRSHIRLKLNQPFGNAVLRFNLSKIAVTLPINKQILIISTSENCLTTVKSFQTDKIPLSLVSLDNGCIGVTFHTPPSFDFIDISGKQIKTLKSYTQDSQGRIFKSFWFVAIDEFRSHVIQPCQKENAVYSFDYSGQPVFEYRDSELRSPQGVSLDQDGNIYICSLFNHMLHVVAPTGIKVKYVKTGVPSCPRAICFDETGHRFWISGTAIHNLEILSVFSFEE